MFVQRLNQRVNRFAWFPLDIRLFNARVSKSLVVEHDLANDLEFYRNFTENTKHDLYNDRIIPLHASVE